jgi:CheY-like chemotaxis protein
MEEVTNNEKLNILHVDDDTDDRMIFEEALKDLKIPYNLFQVSDCYKLLDCLTEGNKPDLIFLDINMPIMDGKECLKIIKATDLYKDVPVIIFTVSKREKDVDDVYKAGAHYHIVKPYARTNFLASLKIIFALNWKEKQPIPARSDFFIDYTY